MPFNVEHAKMLLDVLIREHAEGKVKMASWYETDDVYVNTCDIIKDNLCFTAACAGGWLASLFPEESKTIYMRVRDNDIDNNHEMVHVGSELLGISLIDAANLFHSANSPEYVIEVLKDAIRTGEFTI